MEFGAHMKGFHFVVGSSLWGTLLSLHECGGLLALSSMQMVDGTEISVALNVPFKDHCHPEDFL